MKVLEADVVVVDHQGKLERISLSKGKIIWGAKAKFFSQPVVSRKESTTGNAAAQKSLTGDYGRCS